MNVEMRIEARIDTEWVCADCQVGGRDAGPTCGVRCWNCAGPVVVTARPTVLAAS